MKRLLVLICFILLLISPSKSQDNIKADINAHVSLALPFNQLKGNMDNGYGIGLTALAGKTGFPLKGGFAFNVLWNNLVSEEIYLYNGYYDELYDSSTTSYTFLGDIVLRAEPEIDFPVIPFADIYLGFNRFSTWSSLDGEEPYEDDPIDIQDFDNSYRELGDWTWAYGAAAGCRIRVNPILEDKEFDVLIHLKAGYRKGGAATFLAKKDEYTIIDNTLDAFEERKSITDMLTFHLGLSLMIP